MTKKATIFILTFLFLSLSCSTHIEASKKKAFVAGMLIQSVPPFTWFIGLMGCGAPIRRGEAISLGAGMAFMATLQVTTIYLMVKGLESILSAKS